MNCKPWEDKLDAYADAELPPETMRSLAEHLSACPACTAEMVQIMQQKRVTGAAVKRYTAPPELRARIRRQIESKPARLGWRWAMGLVVGAAVVVGMVLAILLPARTAERNRLIADVVDRHITALASATPVDVVSSDRHTVKPWFQGKLPFTFNLPDLAGSPFVLQGARMVFVDGEPGAHMICDVRQHHVSVIVVQNRGDFPRLLPSAEEQWRSRAFNVESWSRDGLRFFVISDAAPENVSRLAELLKRAN